MTNLTDRQRDIVHTEPLVLQKPSASELQRQRDLDDAVVAAFRDFGSPHDMTALDRMRWIAVVREEFRARQFARWRESEIQSERRLERLRCKAASGMRGSVAARAEMRRVRNAQLREALRS